MGGEPAEESLRSCLFALVFLCDNLGQLLPVVESIIDALLSGDHAPDVLTDLGPKVGELRNIDELNTDRGPRLDTWIDRVSSLTRLQGRLGKRPGRLLVLRVGVGRDALAGRHRGP